MRKQIPVRLMKSRLSLQATVITTMLKFLRQMKKKIVIRMMSRSKELKKNRRKPRKQKTKRYKTFNLMRYKRVKTPVGIRTSILNSRSRQSRSCQKKVHH